MSMNRQMNLPAMQRVMMEFEKQNEIMDMKQEMMEDVMDDVLDEDEMDEESDDIINQVLDEIGINLAQDLVDAPAGLAQPQKQAAQPAAVAEGGGGGGRGGPAAGGGGGGDDVDDLQARLDNLRK